MRARAPPGGVTSDRSQRSRHPGSLATAYGDYVRLMSITAIVLLLVLAVVGVAAFGMRREQAEHPAGAQSLAILLIVVVAVLVLVYLVLQRGR